MSFTIVGLFLLYLLLGIVASYERISLTRIYYIQCLQLFSRIISYPEKSIQGV